MKISEIKDLLKKEKIKSSFEKTYGSGNIKSVWCIIAVVLLVIGVVVMLLPFLGTKIKEDFGTIFFWWFVSLIFFMALFFMSSYLYCKPVYGKDKLRWFKKGFFVTVICLFIIFLLPFIFMIWLTNRIAKVLNLKNMAERAIDSIVALLIWVATFILSLSIMLMIGVLLIPILEEKCSEFYAIMNDKAILCYMVFACMFLSNKVSVKYFFFLNMIEKGEERKKFRSEMTLLWNYTIFVFTLALKPLNIVNPVFNVFVDAFFYSSSVFTLLAKIADGKKKLSED